MPVLPSLLLSVKRFVGPLPLPAPHSPTAQQLQVHELFKRQGTIAIPTLYQGQNNAQPPGTIVGITLGSTLAFLLVVWLFSTLTSRTPGGTTVGTEEVVVRRRSRSPRSRRSRRSEPRSRSPRRDRIITQERIVRDTSRARPGGRYVVEETRSNDYGGANMVEVVEDDPSTVASSAPPRRKSRRGSSRY